MSMKRINSSRTPGGGVLPIIFFIAFFAAGSFSLGAADTNEFLARIYTNAAGRTLPYRLLVPKNFSPTQSYPVILYLHGAAARGNDNEKTLDWGPRLFLDSSLRAKHDFFLVVPQA